MRLLVCVPVLCVAVLPALADGVSRQSVQFAQAAPTRGAKPPSPEETYARQTLAERTAIQSDLVWTGDYSGIIDGDFGKRSVAAVRAFQKRIKRAETGILNPHEREQLAAQARARQEQAGWRRVNDSTTGVSMGLPTKLVPQAGRNKDGARWSSKDGGIQFETFRYAGPSVTLPGVAAQLREVAGRKVEYNVQRPDFVVLTGSQGRKKFYIRAHVQGHEVRGFTILYDAVKSSQMEPITVAVSNAFAPFSGKGTIQVGGEAARRKVEYTTGLIVSAVGQVLADRQATQGCRIIQIPQLGPVERVADDEASGLALLRVYGARNLAPAALAGDAASGDAVTLVGVADPSVQDGGGAISTPSARLSDGTANAPRTFKPMPPLGFSGAPAVDRRGRLFGVVLAKPQVMAGPATEVSAALVPADAVAKFLRDHGVTPAAGSAAVKAIKASVVRVICVRS
jgi:peptidoglycan hydrolase-like protein with peptidoglycan-binding domain